MHAARFQPPARARRRRRGVRQGGSLEPRPGANRRGAQGSGRRGPPMPAPLTEGRADQRAPAPPPPASPLESERAQISRNIGAVLDFYEREEKKISRLRRLLER